MKKKIFIVAMVLMFVVASVALVACGEKKQGDNNSGEQLKQVKFTEDMTKEQICETIKGLENFTIEYVLSENNKDGEIPEDNRLLIGKNFFYYPGAWQFIEGNRVYAYALSDGDEDDLVMITDYTGYDVKENMFTGLQEYGQYVIDSLSTCEYAIENGNLRIFKFEGDEYDVIIKDCNSTVFTVPESFADYKTRKATEDVIEYRLSYDEKSYVISIDSWLRSFEIPAEHNGLPVSFTSSTVADLEEVTLQASITKLESSYYWDGSYEKRDVELHVIFKGTKKQWSEIEKDEQWTSANKVRVTCSDGEYVEESESL